MNFNSIFSNGSNDPYKTFVTLIVNFIAQRQASKDAAEEGDSILQDLLDTLKLSIPSLLSIFVAFLPSIKGTLTNKIAVVETVQAVVAEANLLAQLGPEKTDQVVDIVLAATFSAAIFSPPVKE
jgi:hypothetical protein